MWSRTAAAIKIEATADRRAWRRITIAILQSYGWWRWWCAARPPPP